MDKRKDAEKFIEQFQIDLDKTRKKMLEEARYAAEPVIPSIKEDLGDNSLEITVEDLGVAGAITGPNSFSLNYREFLTDVFGRKPDYDAILGLAQHEKIHLEREFPDVIMREVMVDMAAAEKYGLHALFSFQIRNVKEGDFTSPWIYSLGSLVNLKPLLPHESQKKLVENALKTNYPWMLVDMIEYINFKVPEGKRYASTKLGNVSFTSKNQKEMEELFSEFIQGLSIERRYIEPAVKNPFSPVHELPKYFIDDYKILEDTLVLK
jgi:hypothetical protein